ncbi:hypothetical protein RDV64_23570 (plasmid) [Acuticoccus sp. MNP-M23]|uniref:hypothetical protein n=1 Tax=Acuticoccus sp. MNP-M23 TaxID=3072793 RepID=UPI002814F789|nr:hypothetical protein [Acuticoccus sp. MNP-M23]WMS45316.1 hypothetical protein RDV64_23570 [Acuticoccus sp. MNP-M23]
MAPGADKPDEIRTQLDAVAERVIGETVPSPLREITDRHLTKLLMLVESMRDAGVDEAMVRYSVRELVASYEAELVNAMMLLAQEERE